MAIIKKEFRWFTWIAAIGKYSMIITSYIILLSLSRITELNYSNYFKILTLFPIGFFIYQAYELIRRDNYTFWIITEDKDASQEGQ